MSEEDKIKKRDKAVQDVNPEPALVPTGSCRVVACPRMFTNERVDRLFEPGTRLTEIIESTQPDPVLRDYAHVRIGDWDVPSEFIRHIRVKEGAHVVIRFLPGGRDAGKIFGTIISIAALFAGGVLGAQFGPGIATGLGLTFEGAGTLVGGAITGLFGAVGGLIAGALAPPPKQNLNRLSGQRDDSRTFSIETASNRFRRFEVVPKLLGSMRVIPDNARAFKEVPPNE